METLKVDILDPRARKLLRNLADQNLITIRETPTASFGQLLSKLRNQTQQPPDLEAITAEVEKVRTQRFMKNGECANLYNS
jgi:hypothetical protein